MEQLLQKRTHEFDVERSQLQAHIAHISEELREHLSSQDHAETLKVGLETPGHLPCSPLTVWPHRASLFS